MKVPPTSRDKKKYCHFYQDHGHDIKKYIQLKNEIEVLFQLEYLEKYLHSKEVRPPIEQPVRQQANEGTSN